VLGLAAVGTWWLLRRRGADAQHLRAMTLLCVLLAAQGVVGGVQYLLELPSEIVWVHVALAAFTWLSILWAVAAAGRLEAEPAPEPEIEPEPAAARVPAQPARTTQRV
jgi:cytochrome c oxidase assembly protein subunit 15